MNLDRDTKYKIMARNPLEVVILVGFVQGGHLPNQE